MSVGFPQGFSGLFFTSKTSFIVESCAMKMYDFVPSYHTDFCNLEDWYKAHICQDNPLCKREVFPYTNDSRAHFKTCAESD